MKLPKVLLFLLSTIAFTPCSAQLWTEFSRTTPSGHSVRYTITSDTTVEVKKGYVNIVGELIIPDTVSYNGTVYQVSEMHWYAAFKDLTDMTSVIIPTSIKHIGSSAFEGCTSLTTVSFGDSTQSIGDNAFLNCHNLTTISLPNTVNDIWSCAFKNCYLLDSINIPSGVETINYGTFSNDSSLSHISFAGFLRFIDVHAFENCVGLERINLPHSVDSIAESAFIHSGLKTLRIPDSLKVISSFSFQDCENLDSVFMGMSVRKIESESFEQCHKLRYVEMNSSIVQIGSYAFGWCDSLQSITIPRSIKYIGDGAFCSCEALSYVDYLADSCIRVGWYGQSPFELCTNLSGVLVGENVRSIPSNTFKGCSSVSEIFVEPVIPPTLGDSVFANISNTARFYIPCNTYSQYNSVWGAFNYFEPTVDYQVNVIEDDATMGSAQMNGSISCVDSTVQLVATANIGYRFDHWSTGATDNPYSFIVSSDTTIIAYFTANSTDGIDNVANENDLYIYANNGHITINGVENESIRIFDIVGRNIRNEALPAGVYLVKIGNRMARKIVVIK